MWNVTAEGADLLFSVFSWLLVVAAILVGIATYGVTVMGGAKEHFASERIAANEAETARAVAETNIAKRGAAEANARALEAQLSLEKFKAPRSLAPEQEVHIVEALKKFAPQQFAGSVVTASADARPLWVALARALAAAGWTLVAPIGLAAGDPPAGVPVSPNPGITIVVASKAGSAVASHATSLAALLTEAGIDATAGQSSTFDARPTVITIVIGIKPQ